MRTALLLAAAALLASCARLPITVRSYADAEVDYGGLRTFKLQATNKENPLLEKELLRLARRKLESKGYRWVDKDPDFLVTLFSYAGTYQTYVPPTMSYAPVYDPGHTTVVYGQVGERQFSRTQQETGRWKNRPIVTPGHTETGYFNTIKIHFLDPVRRPEDREPRVLWSGEAQTNEGSDDVRDVAAFLIDETLDEYPRRSGRSARRRRETKEFPDWAR